MDGPASVALPTEMRVSWRAPETWYDAASGFQMEESVVVTIDDARNAEAGVVIAGARVSGGCQQMSLQAVAADGSWDGVARWSFDSVDVSQTRRRAPATNPARCPAWTSTRR